MLVDVTKGDASVELRIPQNPISGAVLHRFLDRAEADLAQGYHRKMKQEQILGVILTATDIIDAFSRRSNRDELRRRDLSSEQSCNQIGSRFTLKRRPRPTDHFVRCYVALHIQGACYLTTCKSMGCYLRHASRKMCIKYQVSIRSIW